MMYMKFWVLVATFVVGGTIFTNVASATSSPSGNTAASLPLSIVMMVSNSKVSASDVATKNVTILSYIKAKGLSKRTVRKAKAQGGCRWIGAGTDVPGYWNSGHSASGGLFWFWDTRHVQICMVHGQWRKVLCGNFIRFKQPVHHVITRGRVIMVRSFAHLKVRIHLVAIAVARGFCGSASARAHLTQKVSLRSFIKTKGRATARLYARLVEKAGVRAKAQVHCQAAVVVVQPPAPPTPPSPPAQPPAPEVTNVTQPQEVFADGETYPNICADVYATNGHSLSVVFSAKYGSFPSSTFKFTSSGHDRPCATYKAPNTPDAAGRNDVITVTVQDDNTGLHDSASSDPFAIESAPVPPV